MAERACSIRFKDVDLLNVVRISAFFFYVAAESNGALFFFEM